MNLHPVVRLLRIDTASAAQVEGSSYVGPTMIPVGAWIVMAWNRFGSQGVFAPRAPVRFILIGFYGWLVLGLALCGFVWLVGDRGAERWDPGAWIRLTGVSHLPILVLAFVIQFAATLLQVFGVGRVMAIVVFVFWMPAMLIAAVRYASGTSLGRGLPIAVIPYAIWYVAVGRYLVGQIGHLL